MASVEIVPKDLRNLRCCLVCSLIKNNKDNIYDCTSTNFDGMVALMSPEDSWVAKWQRINRKTKGIYAVSVSGRLPDNFIRELKSRGIPYRSRDTSQRQ
uniref:EOG090X0NWO n=1 Tax=Alona affinis TaxID=381656 RepID=A0A9N6WWV4_9CRUS|nr:EOG090X0NWO [Alona affinis]